MLGIAVSFVLAVGVTENVEGGGIVGGELGGSFVVASHSVEERMCRWILLTHDRAATDTFALTHEYLSLMLGARRATISAIAHKLKEEGIISYKRAKLRVADRQALEDCSCECYRVIREQS